MANNNIQEKLKDRLFRSEIFTEITKAGEKLNEKSNINDESLLTIVNVCVKNTDLGFKFFNLEISLINDTLFLEIEDMVLQLLIEDIECINTYCRKHPTSDKTYNEVSFVYRGGKHLMVLESYQIYLLDGRMFELSVAEKNNILLFLIIETLKLYHKKKKQMII